MRCMSLRRERFISSVCFNCGGVLLLPIRTCLFAYIWDSSCVMCGTASCLRSKGCCCVGLISCSHIGCVQTVGRAVRVWWDGEKSWYEGIVVRFSSNPALEDSHGICPYSSSFPAPVCSIPTHLLPCITGGGCFSESSCPFSFLPHNSRIAGLLSC